MLSFYDCDKNLSENDFNEVEKKLEVSFPASFKSHYFKWNGGTPNLSCFVNDNIDFDYIEIRDFIPMKYSKQFEDDPDFTLEGRTINEWELNELPINLIPFAFDWGGNYLCLEKNSRQIIYYVRDVWSENISREANFKKNSIIIAKSFDEFLNCLEENPDD
ncbi:SMI1/KNR4 family protein [Streptococcus oralis]|uniref:SMI1 / KNR4 family protein n=1 Tax=Streptococcus oralis subsp. oralis TaxID=1891914 RepID=A0A0F2DB55_STROR|nr:SMI1/KNR4 family protein [Streptococcus oralis]KEQ46271.1 SMI1 / KNR4 family protein [Streptococcus oralis]KJQ67230.1 SMI1 / KNR4 family protein [Streptococcus oralis subsp. oralis]KJQ70648.1 SMI1 / KNR4 family protein [Streptococcus oralis subsp. oralis]MBZ2077094.1 SMI1/KNR4 family protein [Streptococcus oralis]